MPIPRKFDRRPPERDETRINERIRVPQVRLIGEDGNQIGVIDTQKALRYAQERDLDLVEVAADARPPVCRVLDYSKYKYEQEQKAKAARRHQKQVNVREIKLRPKIATNDYQTKKNHVVRFLKGDDRVKVTIMFRGREQTHPERGEMLLMRLADDVAELGTIEQRPQQDGRNMTMLLAPVKRKPAEQAPESDGQPAAAAEPAPPWRSRRRAREPPSVCFNSPSDAEDEDALRRQEALPQDREQEAAGAPLLHEPQPREEAGEAQAPPRAALRGGPARPPPGHGAAAQVSRVKRSVHARKKRRATLERTKGYRGQAKSSYKRAKEALLKADSYAYRDRRNRKRDFRRLWIVRINAAARQEGMSYSQFMHGLKEAGIEVDRKVLADIAVRDPETFRRFAEKAREAVAA